MRVETEYRRQQLTRAWAGPARAHRTGPTWWVRMLTRRPVAVVSPAPVTPSPVPAGDPDAPHLVAGIPDLSADRPPEPAEADRDVAPAR